MPAPPTGRSSGDRPRDLTTLTREKVIDLQRQGFITKADMETELIQAVEQGIVDACSVDPDEPLLVKALACLVVAGYLQARKIHRTGTLLQVRREAT